MEPPKLMQSKRFLIEYAIGIHLQIALFQLC